MELMETARRLAELGQKTAAQEGYTLALHEGGLEPAEELEAAMFLFVSQAEDHTLPYRTFVSLFNRGLYQGELLDLLTQAFYFPNVKDLQKRYEANCKRLAQYPYLFRRDFPAFEDLPLLFFPFDDAGYLPYYPEENRFGDYVNFNDPVIDRYFFQNLENPILAKDVYSQYQLEYLNDNVRKSEWVGRENHIYLHYTSWPAFCAHLQCLKLKELLKDEKLVFLMEDEVVQYPINFKARFGLDYSQYPVKPVGIREVTRLIWHTQLATHNGGDFFNEIFFQHPNLLAFDTMMFENIKDDLVGESRRQWEGEKRYDTDIERQLNALGRPTDKDFLVAVFLKYMLENEGLDPAARIVPALFFQPHFYNMIFNLEGSDKTGVFTLLSEEYDKLRNASFLKGFKYIKTFTPLRRPTTSHAATVRFAVNYRREENQDQGLADFLLIRLLNRSFWVDPEDRLYHDSALVRFEDGKLNPKATFTALAEFLDLPYTETMKVATGWYGESLGFDPVKVYETYDQYAGDGERALIEYFFQDAYRTYGYDFQYYHGETADDAWLEEQLEHTKEIDGWLEKSYEEALQYRRAQGDELAQDLTDETIAQISREEVEHIRTLRSDAVHRMRKIKTLVNKSGEPLRLMTPLKLDPALLEQPLYH